MTDNLFNENVDANNEVDPDKALEELIGPGGKFYDPDREVAIKNMAKGKVLADRTVQHKNSEYDKLREDYLKIDAEYKAGQTLKEMMDDLRKSQATNSNSTPPKANEEVLQPLMTQDDIDLMIQSKLAQHENVKKQTENFNSVMGKLKEQHGNNYQAVLQDHMDRLGLDKEFVNDLAKQHPAAFMRTFGLDSTQSTKDLFQSPPKTQQRSDNYAPNTQKRTWSYYENLRKTKPEQYTNPKTQVQMMKDAVELGSEFKDGNFVD